MASSAQAILDAVASIEAAMPKQEEKDKKAAQDRMAEVPGAPDIPTSTKVPSLQAMLKTTIDHPQMQALASHPDFPALAQDSGVQALVTALTNQVGHVLNGIKGSGQNVAGITLD